MDDAREIDGIEQHHRIDVLVADAQSEVHHARRVVRSGAAGRPTVSPAATRSPRCTETDARNEYDVRRPPAWAITT